MAVRKKATTNGTSRIAVNGKEAELAEALAYLNQKFDTLEGQMSVHKGELSIEIGKRLDAQKVVSDRIGALEKEARADYLEFTNKLNAYNAKPFYKRLFSKI